MNAIVVGVFIIAMHIDTNNIEFIYLKKKHSVNQHDMENLVIGKPQTTTKGFGSNLNQNKIKVNPKLLFLVKNHTP